MRGLLLLLLLGLLALHQSSCFEFVIDGEWEDEEPEAPDHQERHKRATLTSEEEEDFEAVRGDDITVKSYRVESRITSRFAHTSIRSSVTNSGSRAQSIGFSVKIPKRAFISNFTMNVNGITFVGSVKEKTVARRLYAQATARNKAAGIVRTNSQDLETFNTEVHVPPGSNIEFELHYQEMMERRLGWYEHSLHLQPGRLVPKFQVDVYIYEPKGISTLEVPNTLGEQFAELINVTRSKDKAHIVFKPNINQQRKCKNCTSSAINGVFSVNYDVTRDSNAGELQVSDLHFIHFFAPSNLSPLPKNIVFVIDVSGSMWGVKMKQTVEAMKAILDDLKIEDRFSIIDFNHNVRCWNEDLVPASSVMITDAKRYIQDIKPNGGTNINEALIRAAQMLVRASNQGFINSRSVSMIILVSDGDPTVGEIKLSKIQKNVKKVMTKDFSLFSLGIGFDVDYDFLERISMENRGIARRIYANQDAAEQIRTFYSQVSSPLLKEVAIHFTEGTVTDVTQTYFDKYFGGSELVVAGKVQLSESTTLTSFTTAAAASGDLTLHTDTDVLELDTQLTMQQHSFTGFARQMWAYLTIKQLIRERAVASTVGKKRKITKQITELALQHSFVTPLTALLVENEDATERLLADSPKDPRQGCCTGGHALPGPVDVVYSRPPPWVQTPTPTPSSQARGGPVATALPSTVNIVDNDPHFIIHLPRSNMDVCFNIDSKPGHILSLVSDAGTGVVVNGQLISSKQPHRGKLNTYFGIISVYYQPEGVSVTVHTDRITIIAGRTHQSFTWSATAEITQAGVTGQFSREPEVSVSNVHPGPNPLKKEATMEVKGHKLQVTRGWQKDYRHDSKRGFNVYCWFIHNSGKGFIDGHYSDYILPGLSSFLPTP
ncbi:PREDICTED: inter-alpha-trypsin inhibitor heavy chain H2 [Cyprinodon variegatus]|uniref:inter-alpha-trypsin inhibitor heavy chain H2 n=1 Tax=Cyprinodon variegatus TaxID=28743 RepID=UPI000742CCC8|nr:PREDICTED: inter-alpha-trypsin inhibitor heavy chain H2 [Cyprinodon variegatus]